MERTRHSHRLAPFKARASKSKESYTDQGFLLVRKTLRGSQSLDDLKNPAGNTLRKDPANALQD
jgi:hypothetical protein